MPTGEQRLRTDEGRLNQCGPQVKAKRRELKLNAEQICARLDIHTNGKWRPKRDDLYKLEAGVRQVSDLELMALAAVLETDVAWLLVLQSAA